MVKINQFTNVASLDRPGEKLHNVFHLNLIKNKRSSIEYGSLIAKLPAKVLSICQLTAARKKTTVISKNISDYLVGFCSDYGQILLAQIYPDFKNCILRTVPEKNPSLQCLFKYFK